MGVNTRSFWGPAWGPMSHGQQARIAGILGNGVNYPDILALLASLSSRRES